MCVHLLSASVLILSKHLCVLIGKHNIRLLRLLSETLASTGGDGLTSIIQVVYTADSDCDGKGSCFKYLYSS